MTNTTSFQDQKGSSSDHQSSSFSHLNSSETKPVFSSVAVPTHNLFSSSYSLPSVSASNDCNTSLNLNHQKQPKKDQLLKPIFPSAKLIFQSPPSTPDIPSMNTTPPTNSNNTTNNTVPLENNSQTATTFNVNNSSNNGKFAKHDRVRPTALAIPVNGMPHSVGAPASAGLIGANGPRRRDFDINTAESMAALHISSPLSIYSPGTPDGAYTQVENMIPSPARFFIPPPPYPNHHPHHPHHPHHHVNGHPQPIPPPNGRPFMDMNGMIISHPHHPGSRPFLPLPHHHIPSMDRLSTSAPLERPSIRTRFLPNKPRNNGPPSSGLVSPHKMGGVHFPSSSVSSHGAVGGITGSSPMGDSHSGGKLYQCDACGKCYKHPNCLSKHKWEHSEYWKEASKFSLSKHQQVQMLEAASILIGFSNNNNSNSNNNNTTVTGKIDPTSMLSTPDHSTPTSTTNSEADPSSSPQRSIEDPNETIRSSSSSMAIQDKLDSDLSSSNETLPHTEMMIQT